MADTDSILSVKEGNKNIPVLFPLRAIAALSVCFFHFVCTVTGFFHNPFLLKFFSFGKYGVQMFFVISGFVIPWSMYNEGYKIKNFFTFLFKRLVRLEPPYIVSLVIAVILLISRQHIIEHVPIHINFTQVFLHFGYLIPFFKGYRWLNNVYWTLAIEFQFYIFTGIFFVFLIRSKLLLRTFLYVIAIALSLYVPGAFLPRYSIFFVLGFILFLKKSNHIGNAEFYIASAVMLLACFYKFSFGRTGYAIVAFVAITFLEKKDNKIMHFIGKISYSIYLFHALIGATFINVLSHQAHSPIIKIAIVLTGVAISIISAYIMYLLVEKPSKRLSSKFKYSLK